MRQIKALPGVRGYAETIAPIMEDRMTRLALVIFSILSVTCMGIAIIVALVAGWDTLVPIVVAAGVGLLASVPASWIVARQIADA